MRRWRDRNARLDRALAPPPGGGGGDAVGAMLSAGVFDSVLRDALRVAHRFTRALAELLRCAGWDLAAAAAAAYPGVAYSKHGGAIRRRAEAVARQGAQVHRGRCAAHGSQEQPPPPRLAADRERHRRRREAGRGVLRASPDLHLAVAQGEGGRLLDHEGTKLPQRPKKRAKNVDKTLQYVFPGMWLSDLTRGRCEVLPMLNKPMRYSTSTFQRFGFSSSAPQKDDKEANKPTDDGGDKSTGSKDEAPKEANNTSGAEKAPKADTEDLDLSEEDLVKLVLEKEDLLKSKDEEIKDMKDKVLRSYAEMENVIARTKRESENSKKYAVQGFSKSLLDVADNLSRASSVVKESFSKIDPSNDSAEAVQLLKTLLGGVEMTEKQLGEVFKKFGVEKFDPQNEKFDPNRHYALFQIPDPSKPSGTVAAVLKVGYMLHDRVLRPSEVGVTEGGPTEEEPEEKSS